MPRAIAILAIVAAVAWAAYAWWPSEERRVRKRIAALADAVNDTPRDGLQAVARAARLASFFDADVVYQLGPSSPPRQGREELVALAAANRNDRGPFKLSFVDVSVSVTGDTASSHLTATLEWQDGNGQPNVDAREAALDWRKTDAWRITRITAVAPMEKPY
jgi:ketosteroid isomerase-like protein